MVTAPTAPTAPAASTDPNDPSAVGPRLIDLLDAVIYLDRKQVVAEQGVRLHPSESHLLLCAVEGMSFTQIAHRFAVSKGAVSQVFARLAAKGVVVVRKDPARKNAAEVTLTPLGDALRARTEELRGRLATALDDRLADYTPAELTTVHRFLGDLHGFVTSQLTASAEASAAQPGRGR
jgi:DNA-binding MarR family transcriptional regulator